MDQMLIYNLFEQNSDILVDLTELFMGKKISIMVFNWSVLISSFQTSTLCEPYIISYSCILGNLINQSWWVACAWSKLQ